MRYKDILLEGRWKYKSHTNSSVFLTNIYNGKTIKLSYRQVNNVYNGKDTIGHIQTRRIKGYTWYLKNTQKDFYRKKVKEKNEIKKLERTK